MRKLKPTTRSLIGTYITFNSLSEFSDIINIYEALGVEYKKGTLDNLYDVVSANFENKEPSERINKITFNEQVVVTSKAKKNVVAFKIFKNIIGCEGITVACDASQCVAVEDITDELFNTINTKENTMSTYANRAEEILANKAIDKAYDNEKFLKEVASKGKGLKENATNLIEAIQVADEKACRALELNDKYNRAVDNGDLEAIKSIGGQIDEAVAFITKGNKVLAQLNSAGSDIATIRKAKEDAPKTGAEIIGDILD